MRRWSLAAGVSAASIVSVLLLGDICFAENFKILLYRETGRDTQTQVPTGKLLINGGWLEGIEPGATGTLWRKNKYAGRVDLANVEVVELAAHEAQCRFVLTHPDHLVTKKDKVEFAVVPRTAVDILARAMEEFGNQRFCEAWIYFRDNDSLTEDNAFAQQVADQCRSKAREASSQPLEDEERRRAKARLGEYLEIAQTYRELGNLFMADQYVRRALMLDSTSASARKLRSEIPEAEF